MTSLAKTLNNLVLIIEDDADIRRATVRLLRNAGYKVESVTNGLEAMSYLHTHALPRLILLDLNMPVMDGWQFRLQQEEDPILRGIPVVVLSSENNLEQTAEAMHAESCLHKPIEEDALLDTVRKSRVTRTRNPARFPRTRRPN
jgi:CheY-like chemotaxis protein